MMDDWGMKGEITYVRCVYKRTWFLYAINSFRSLSIATAIPYSLKLLKDMGPGPAAA
jgi:hypothetical protein